MLHAKIVDTSKKESIEISNLNINNASLIYDFLNNCHLQRFANLIQNLYLNKKYKINWKLLKKYLTASATILG